MFSWIILKIQRIIWTKYCVQTFSVYSLSQYKDILHKEQIFTLSARQLSINYRFRIKYGNKEDAVFVIRIAILKSY